MAAKEIRDERGQALLEVAVVLPILVFAVVESLWILHATTNRTECARRVFEATRRALERNDLQSSTRNGVMVRTAPGGMIGSKKCGSHFESQFLPNLGERNPGAFPSPSS